MSIWLTPALLLGALLSLGYASIFHLWRGKGIGDLLLTIPIAMLGFGIGQLVSPTTATALLDIGQLHVLEGTAGAWLALAVVGILHR